MGALSSCKEARCLFFARMMLSAMRTTGAELCRTGTDRSWLVASMRTGTSETAAQFEPQHVSAHALARGAD